MSRRLLPRRQRRLAATAEGDNIKVVFRLPCSDCEADLSSTAAAGYDATVIYLGSSNSDGTSDGSSTGLIFGMIAAVGFVGVIAIFVVKRGNTKNPNRRANATSVEISTMKNPAAIARPNPGSHWDAQTIRV